MDSIFDEVDSTLLLLLFLTTLTGGGNEITEEKLEEKLEDGLEVSTPEPVRQEEALCYIHKSSNRKRLKPKAVYF